MLFNLRAESPPNPIPRFMRTQIRSARQLGIDRQIRVRQGNLERTRNPARYIVVLARQP